MIRLVGVLIIALGVTATVLPQEHVIRDESPVKTHDLNTHWTDTSAGSTENRRGAVDRSWRSSRLELVVGMAFFGGVLIYGFLRYQAREGRRR